MSGESQDERQGSTEGEEGSRRKCLQKTHQEMADVEYLNCWTAGFKDSNFFPTLKLIVVLLSM